MSINNNKTSNMTSTSDMTTYTSEEAKDTMRDVMRELIDEKTDSPCNIIYDIQKYVVDYMVDDVWFNDEDEVMAHFNNEFIYHDFLSTKGNGLDNLGQGMISHHNSFSLVDINAIFNEMKDMGYEVDNFKHFEDMINIIILSKAQEIWSIIEPMLKNKHKMIIYTMLCSDDKTAKKIKENKKKSKK